MLNAAHLVDTPYKYQQIDAVRDTNLGVVSQLGLENISVFHVLMRERNTTRVADQGGLTQQAVSDQLRKMRIIFDDPLFVRMATGLILR